jgi:2-amino-4-hydroxy-6-hydroxymethyldihydropteridine diphosphokinase
MILIALGSNLAGEFGSPQGACEAALAALAAHGVEIQRRSAWYRSVPQPASDQPDFVNGVAAVRSELGPDALLALLHEVEAEMGRQRIVVNAARIIDLDLLDYEGLVRRVPGGLQLPHPRLMQRAFVLLPLAEVAPNWVHPETGAQISDLISAMALDQGVERLREP